MIKAYINVLVMVFSSWAVYGYCQRDALLPIMAGTLMIVGLLMRLKSAEKQYALFQRMSLPVIVIVSILTGLLWRTVVPIPPDADSHLLKLLSALQSASIVAGVLIALRPFTKLNMYRLAFCAWITVPLSINVPFSQNMLFVFAEFTLIALSVVIVNTMHSPSNRKYKFLYARDYVIFSSVLMAGTIVFFLAISSTIVIMETAFFNTMSNYILPRQYTNFLNIRPNLNLISPGVSAQDRRPVMEISMPKSSAVYLKMQVFDEYHNGTWSEVKNVLKSPLPVDFPAGQSVGRIVMFTPLKNLVPSPRGITAIKANVPYVRSQDQIIYAEDRQNSRILEFSYMYPARYPVTLSDEEYRRHTALPEAIATQLKTMATSITLGQGDAAEKAVKLVDYFNQNFKYSLDVSFTADDKGLIKMLEEKRPAYCTYFASALALLMRAEGVPARVASGFSTTERIDARNNTFLARVRNAHAWTEVLVPYSDALTGRTSLRWRAFDATPRSYASIIEEKSLAYALEMMFERMWLAALRFKARIEHVDQEQLKVYGTFGLLGVMALINRRRIMSGLRRWLDQQARSKKLSYKTPDSLRTIYTRYENHLRQEYGEVRRPSDTDADVLVRIKEKTSRNSIAHLETFVHAFQAARFGAKTPEQLKTLLKQLLNYPGG